VTHAAFSDGDPIHAPELRAALLGWWEVHGRHTIPWKCTTGGQRPARGEPLDPYGIWVAKGLR